MAPAWQHYRDGYVLPMREAGCLPSDLFEPFSRMLADPAVQMLIKARADSLADQPAESPFDSHPSLARRLELIRMCPPGATGHDPRLAAQLLGDRREALLGAVQATVLPYRHGLLPVLPPPEWEDKTAEVLAGRQADRLVHAASEAAGGGPQTLHSLLAAVEPRSGALLARGLRPPGTGLVPMDADAGRAFVLTCLLGGLLAFLVARSHVHAHWP